MKDGDNNTKNFHKYVEHMHNGNTIWELNSGDGKLISNLSDLQGLAMHHFKYHYSDPGNFLVTEHIKVIKEYPRFFSNEELGDNIFLLDT